MRLHSTLIALFFLLNLQAQSGLVDTTAIDSLNELTATDTLTLQEKIKIGESAVKLASVAEYTPGSFKALMNIGLSHYELDNFDDALDNFQQASLLITEMEEPELKAEAAYYIGKVHRDLNNITQAEEKLQEALELSRDSKNKTWMGIILNDLGEIYSMDEKKQKKALNSYKESLSILEANEMDKESSSPLNNIGQYYLRKGDYKRALQYFGRALSLYQKYGESKGETRSLINHGIIFRELYQPDSAFTYFDKALQIADSLQYRQDIYQTYYELALTYKAKNDAENALFFYEQYFNMKDSVINEEKNNQIAKLLVQYETEKKERELTESQRKVTFLEQEKKIGKLTQYIVSSLFVFVIIIGLLLYSRYKMKQELVETELESTHFERQKLKKELEFKQKDLTNFALDIARKNDFSNQILERLQDINRSRNSDFQQKKIRELLTFTSQHLKINEDFKALQMNVEKVSQDFFDTLDAQFPELTNNEKQLCGLIRLNLSTKDIAAIKNISPKSVEMGRYRLRKKLSLTPKEEISAFLKGL